MSPGDSKPLDHVRNSRLGFFAVGGMLTWLAGELLLRHGGVALLDDLIGSVVGADMILGGIGFPILALGIAVWGRRTGIAPAAWRYDWSFRPVIAGVGGVIVYFILYTVFMGVYALAVGFPSTPSSPGSEMMPGWVLALVVIVNGFIGPVTEELAWRGVIQTALVREYGPLLGIGATAAAFVAKHLVVDMAAPVFRVVSLIIIAVVLGLVRHRYGTASSTVTHICGNLLLTTTVFI